MSPDFSLFFVAPFSISSDVMSRVPLGLVHCGLVLGLARVVTWCSAHKCPGSRHNLSCCSPFATPLEPQLVCPLLNLLPRLVARALCGAYDQPVHCGLVRGLARFITWCSAYECPGSRHNLSCLTPLATPVNPQLVCPLLDLLPRHVARALIGTHDQPVHCGLVRGLARVVRRCSACECSFSRQNLSCCSPFAAILHTSRILEPSVEHKVQDKHTLLVYARAHSCHFSKIKQC